MVDYVREAQRRGLTCGVLERTAGTSSANPAQGNVYLGDNLQLCNERQLCDFATYGSPKRWQRLGLMVNYANEAKRRGLSCGVAEQAVTSTSVSTRSETNASSTCELSQARSCPAAQVCELATNSIGDTVWWRRNTAPRWVYEAERRGLSCGVATSPRSSSSSSSTQRTTTRSASSYGEHGQECANYGFVPGTDAFAACIQRETINAANEQQRRRERVADAWDDFFDDLGELNRNNRLQHVMAAPVTPARTVINN